MTGVDSLLPACSYYPENTEYIDRYVERTTTDPPRQIREVEHVLRGVLLIQNGDVSLETAQMIADHIREEQREKINNIHVTIPHEAEENELSITGALSHGEQKRMRQAKEKIDRLKNSIINEYINPDFKWDMGEVQIAIEKAETIQETHNVTFEITKFVSDTTNNNHKDKIQREWIDDAEQITEHSIRESLKPSAFGFKTPITLPSCVVTQENSTNEERFAFIPWNGVITCNCQYKNKKSRPSRTLCQHEILAIQKIANENEKLSFANHGLPQRFKRFVHKSGYKKAREILTGEYLNG